jgi:hypothetical protein
MSLAFVYQAEERWDQAIEVYERAREIFATEGDSHREGYSAMMLGILREMPGNYEQAAFFWHEAVEKLHPDSSQHADVVTWLHEREDNSEITDAGDSARQQG